MVVILNVFRRANPRRMNDRFRRLQVISAAFMAFSHGSNDAQKTMGIITLALIAAGVIPTDSAIPLWVIVLAATRDLARDGGRRLADHQDDGPEGRRSSTRSTASPPRRPRRRSSSRASHFGMPVSTTHVISSAIMGVGSSDRLSAVRWGVAGNIVIAWILTIPASALAAGVAYVVISPFL